MRKKLLPPQPMAAPPEHIQGQIIFFTPTMTVMSGKRYYYDLFMDWPITEQDLLELIPVFRKQDHMTREHTHRMRESDDYKMETNLTEEVVREQKHFLKMLSMPPAVFACLIPPEIHWFLDTAIPDMAERHEAKLVLMANAVASQAVQIFPLEQEDRTLARHMITTLEWVNLSGGDQLRYLAKILRILPTWLEERLAAGLGEGGARKSRSKGTESAHHV